MKPKVILIRLLREGRHIRMIVRSRRPSSLYEPATWSYCKDGVTSRYLRLFFPDSRHSPSLADFGRLFGWIQNRTNPPLGVPEILERLNLNDEFGRLSQEHPLETLQMFAALNESPLTAEMVFDFE